VVRLTVKLVSGVTNFGWSLGTEELSFTNCLITTIQESLKDDSNFRRAPSVLERWRLVNDDPSPMVNQGKRVPRRLIPPRPTPENPPPYYVKIGYGQYNLTTYLQGEEIGIARRLEGRELHVTGRWVSTVNLGCPFG